MTEEYHFVQVINGKKTNKAVFSFKEAKLIINGLIYARERDCVEGRKKEYQSILQRLNNVMYGQNKY